MLGGHFDDGFVFRCDLMDLCLFVCLFVCWFVCYDSRDAT